MQKITSFTIDHLKLQPGVYVSRKDPVGDSLITTFDIRMTSPNEEPVMNTAEVHTIEHLGATFLRNHPDFGSKTIYFGPMGCRTGFYLLLAGDYTSGDIVPLMTEMFTFIRDYHDEVPGASPKDCGNYLDMNLSMANYLANRFLTEVLTDIKEDRLVYPEEILSLLSGGEHCCKISDTIKRKIAVHLNVHNYLPFYILNLFRTLSYHLLMNVSPFSHLSPPFSKKSPHTDHKSSRQRTAEVIASVCRQHFVGG